MPYTIRTLGTPAALSVAIAIVACPGPEHRAGASTLAPDIQMLESPASAGASEPNLTVGPDGRVYLSWMEPAPDSAMSLKFASFDGSKWSAAQSIQTTRDFFVNWADYPSLAVQKNGRMAAHWLQRFGKTSYAYDVRIAQSADGGKTWGTPFAPHADRSATEKGFVTLWRDGDGFGAVWLDGRKADKAGKNPVQEMMLFATTFGTSGAPAKETALDARTCDCCQTTAAMTADGPVVVYRDRSPNEIRDMYVTRRVRGTWTEPKVLHADGWEINACPVNGPSVDAAGRNVVVAWYTGAKDVPHVKVAFSSDAGATFSAPITVDDGNPAGRVAAGLLKDGSALVSWIERTRGDTASVRVRRVSEKAGAGAPATVTASSAARASGFPRMVIADGNAYFAWTVPGRPSTVRVARANGAAFR